jgi:NTE family protein
LTGRDSLHDNRRFYAFLQKKGITPAAIFGDYADWVQLYVTATTLRTGELQVFGDNPHDRVLDALMASTALTPMHPPWVVDGERYVDGGTVTPLPLRVAIERGATEIYSLYIVEDLDVGSPGQIVRGVGGVLTRTVSTMFKLQAEHDLLLAQYAATIKLHNIELLVKSPPGPIDFSQADRLIDAGYQMTQDYLARQIGQKQANAAKGLTWWQRTTERLRRSLPEDAGAALPAPGLPD